MRSATDIISHNGYLYAAIHTEQHGNDYINVYKIDQNNGNLEYKESVVGYSDIKRLLIHGSKIYVTQNLGINFSNLQENGSFIYSNQRVHGFVNDNFYDSYNDFQFYDGRFYLTGNSIEDIIPVVLPIYSYLINNDGTASNPMDLGGSKTVEHGMVVEPLSENEMKERLAFLFEQEGVSGCIVWVSNKAADVNLNPINNVFDASNGWGKALLEFAQEYKKKD
ncbi:unnamed protein product [Diamesa hyperborea]